MHCLHHYIYGSSQDFNIGAGAKFFSQLLDENDGDLLTCIGHYNGWFKGMTYVFYFVVILDKFRC